MRKLFVFLVVLILGLGLSGRVVAEEEVGGDTATEAGVVGDDVGVPDPESRFFGLQVAWSRVSESIERALAFSQEKKAEVEAKYLERDLRLQERIELVLEEHPERAEKLEQHRVKLEERYEKRFERLEGRMERLEERGENFEDKKDEWTERMEEKMENLELRRQNRATRSGGLRNQGGNSGQTPPGRGVNLRDTSVDVVPAE